MLAFKQTEQKREKRRIERGEEERNKKAPQKNFLINFNDTF